MTKIRAEYQKEYAKINSKKKLLSTKEYIRRQRRAVLELLGNKCIRCGFSDYRALQVDHINGGGLKDKKSTKGTYWNKIIHSFLAGEKKYQLLCANCNWIKKFENKEHRNNQ